jgi:hypothetical protein
VAAFKRRTRNLVANTEAHNRVFTCLNSGGCGARRISVIDGEFRFYGFPRRATLLRGGA